MTCRSRNSFSIGLIAILTFLTTASCNSTKVSRDGWKGFSVSCTSDDPQNVSVSCHGVRIVRRIMQQLLEKSSNQRSVELFDGISLVDTKDGGSIRSARVLKGSGSFGSILQFLEGRELRIKLPSFFPSNIEAALKESLPTSSNQGRGGGGGGGGKKGDGGVMIMALMMGKMMMAMGFSALGVLAMKALMVSSLALMLSLITAVKKLASKDDKDEHHVVYAQEVGHHHRKRSVSINDNLELSPYRGYVDLYANAKSS